MFIEVAVAIAVIIIIYLLKTTWFSPFYNFPRTKVPPIIGSVARYWNTDHIDTMVEVANEFKEEGLYYEKSILLWKGAVTLTKCEYAKKYLLNAKTQNRNRKLNEFLPMVGNGILTSEGTFHHWQRRLLSKAFLPEQLAKYVPKFVSYANLLTERWREEALRDINGANIEVYEPLVHFALDVIGDTGFGYKFNNLQNQHSPLAEGLKKCIDVTLDIKSRVFEKIFPFLTHFSSRKEARQKVLQTSADAVKQIIEARKKELETSNSDDHNDILSIMLQAKDEETGTKMTEELIQDNIFTFLFAGNETTASSLSYTLYALAKYTDIQEELRTELTSVIKDKNQITMDELDQVPLLEHTIKESLRLYPIVANGGRMMQDDLKFGEYTVPKGNFFIVQYGVYHKDEQYFKQPESFCPFRFSEKGGEGKSGAWMPFSYGPYDCIGKKFAMLEMRVALARLLLEFTFSVDPEFEMKRRTVRITVKPDPAITIRIRTLEQHKEELSENMTEKLNNLMKR